MFSAIKFVIFFTNFGFNDLACTRVLYWLRFDS